MWLRIQTFLVSLSARRAWIEMERVNNIAYTDSVALRKESVDRNLVGCINRAIDIVALRKESVDRNCLSRHLDGVNFGSLSARRAWIEM